MFWNEDSLVASLQERSAFDRVLILSDHLDHCAYFDCGLPFQSFYAELAGVPEAAGLPLRLRLPVGQKESARNRLAAEKVGPRYAVLHTRAGWPERSPESSLFAALCAHLLGRGLTPVIVGYLFGRYVLKLNPALLLGSITGAMTSTPSLNIVTKAANSSIPSLGYAGTYTFANIFLTFAGTLLMTL